MATMARASDLVGNTPLVELRTIVRGPTAPRIFAKLERFNPGGSAKDRPAAAMIDAACASGALGTGGTIVESSSGNLGVSLAQQALWRGLRFVCVVDPRINPTTRRLIEAYGGEVVCVDRPHPVSGDWLEARIERVRQIVSEVPGAYWPNQYANPDNSRAHRDGTMREVAEALAGDVAAVFVATSTTGTARGCLDYIAAHGLSTKVVAVDAVGSCLFGGTRGERLLPGYGAGVESAIAVGTMPDEVIRIEDLDAVRGCRLLAATEGLLAGASGGAAVAALVNDAHRYGPEDNVVVILHDAGEPYLETVYDDEWVMATFGCSADDLRIDRMVPAPAVVP